jgi:hypothetical protein
MIDDMMVRNLSPATQQSDLYAVAKFSGHFGRSLDQLGLEEVRAYQTAHVAANTADRHPARLGRTADVTECLFGFSAFFHVLWQVAERRYYGWLAPPNIPGGVVIGFFMPL